MSFTFCTSQAIAVKAGRNVNASAASSSALLTQFSDEAEGLINSLSRYDFTTNYASLLTSSKTILGEVASDLAAIYLINYDMSGYTSRGEAESMITVLRDAAIRGLNIVKDKKVQDFL